MVVKRQCSFCADEIEPGTGTMFVKRDGSVFHFCSSSCRKQQLHLGRVGHRLKWTRAHSLKRAAEQSQSAARRATAGRPTTPKGAEPEPRPQAKGKEKSAPSETESDTQPAKTSTPTGSASKPAAEKKPKSRKSKSPTKSDP